MMMVLDPLPRQQQEEVVGDASSSRKNENALSHPRKCPFASADGFVTVDGQQEYVKYMDRLPSSSISKQSSLQIRAPSTCLQASSDPNEPLYSWQLFSLLGEQAIVDLITTFYEIVFQDDSPDTMWFRQVFFESGDASHHHIRPMVDYWVDALGGGRRYIGGAKRLNNLHEFSGESIMNARGAKQWMVYMRKALLMTSKEWSHGDDRILPCLVDFLAIKMMVYSEHHGWEYDPSDFEGIVEQDSSCTVAPCPKSDICRSTGSNRTVQSIAPMCVFQKQCP